METFIRPKKLVENPKFIQQKNETVSNINFDEIDLQLHGIIRKMNSLPHIFTLQCCWGHFLSLDQKQTIKIDELYGSDKMEKLLYKIAYIAVCIQNCREGKRFLQELEKAVSIDPWFIHFGSAEWFWQQQVNSYVLQVTPERFRYKDNSILDYEESLRVQNARNVLFKHLS